MKMNRTYIGNLTYKMKSRCSNFRLYVLIVELPRHIKNLTDKFVIMPY